MLQSYSGYVNFAGYIGADEEYIVTAENEDDAIYEMLERAKEDLEVIDIEQIDDNEYEVSVGFCGYIGVEEVYTVYADSEDEASEEALSEAYDDLSAELSEEEDEEDF